MADQQTAPAGEKSNYTPRLYKQFTDDIRGKLKEELGLKNVMQVPRLKKIVLNMGVGEAKKDEKILQQAEGDLASITGLKPKRTKAKISVAAFKLRQGEPVGCCVTLRGSHMYEFLERLINVAIPRIRDFRGLSPKSFDGAGNYNFGIREHLIFTEIDTVKSPHSLGMNITIVVDAADKTQCRALLKHFGFPFRES